MKIFTASLATETNTFCPIPTGYANFAETCLVRNGKHGEHPLLFALPLRIFRQKAETRGWSVVESLCAFAQPAGRTVRAVYESFRDEMLSDLRRAMPVDMVMLSLHGAMVADGYDDCEGDMLARIRELVGPEIPVGAELDLHCHLTPMMVEHATALINFKEYPHVDIGDRAVELFDIIAAAAEGKIKPVISVFDCRMIGLYFTNAEPMRSYLADLRKLEGRNGVLSVSVNHGFPWADVPHMGAKIMVITDGQKQAGDALARKLGKQFFDLRDKLTAPYLGVEEGVEKALGIDRSPVVLADIADNAGGGAPTDSTFILREMLKRGVQNAAIGCMWDPIGVSMAMDAGVGAKLNLRIGGKIGPTSGDPVDLEVTVTGIKPKATQFFGPEKSRIMLHMGDTVAVRSQGIDIVLNSIRTQTFSLECFECVGVDPRRKRIVVVKSAQHFREAFAPIAAEILYVTAPGPMVHDYASIPYRHIDRNQWPLVADPWAKSD